MENKTVSIDSIIKQDNKDRKAILKEVEKNLMDHSEKLAEAEKINSDYNLLKIKYDSLKREADSTFGTFNKQIKNLEDKSNNLEKENVVLKKIINDNNLQISGLKTIVELLVNKYGINTIENIKSLSEEKINEYLEDNNI